MNLFTMEYSYRWKIGSLVVWADHHIHLWQTTYCSCPLTRIPLNILTWVNLGWDVYSVTRKSVHFNLVSLTFITTMNNYQRLFTHTTMFAFLSALNLFSHITKILFYFISFIRVFNQMWPINLGEHLHIVNINNKYSHKQKC